MTDRIVEVNNLTKRIGNKTIVDQLTFDIHKGEVLGFLGPNGAGKTTTMRMMVGLISINGGDVKIGGHSILKEKEKALRKVGGIVENPEMYKFLTGYDNLVHFARMTGRVDHARIKEVSKLVGLEKAINSKVKAYSLGMRQRLGIAQALLHRPDILILDEPTNGLDPAGIRELRDYIRGLARETGLSVFVSSHLLSEIELLCDRVVIIQNGKLTKTEDINTVTTEEDVLDIAFTANPLEKALEAVSQIENAEAAIDIEHDRLIVKAVKAQIPAVNRALVEAGVSVYSIEILKKSLEDRFLEMTQGGAING